MVTYLPEPRDFHKYWYFDIEADSLWPSKLWLLCASRMDREEVHSFVGLEEIRRFFAELKGTDVYFVGHNAISYDCVHTRRLADGFANSSNTIDTLVLSYLYDPHLAGGHSLEAWGHRVGSPKGSFDDWSGYSPEMDQYCQQDVRAGKLTAKALWARMRRMGYSEKSCEIEHRIREVVDRQERAGWSFDIPGATALMGSIRAERDALEGPIRELFPPELKAKATYNRRKKQDGTDFATYLRHVETYPQIIEDLKAGTYTTWDWNEFNIGSPIQRVERLLALGWQPQDFTDTKSDRWPEGFPKVNEDSLLAYAEVGGKPEMKAIAEWLVMTGRSSMIETWLDNVNYDDSCMHGRILTCGAVTRRMTHSGPNTANIPKAKAKIRYGVESRRLWQARPGRKEVGFDAKGLEGRMFGHYINNKEASDLFIYGDPHMVNTRNLGLPDEYRDLTVKNGFYAFLYGAGDERLGKTIKPELSGRAAKTYGKWARGVLENAAPGLARLIAECKAEGDLLRTVDGGFVRCDSPNARLNYRLQSAGAIVMKEAVIIAQSEIDRRGLDGFFVGNIHDEGQLDCSPGDAEEVGKVCIQALVDAGESLGFRVPIEGDYKVGNNWADCH